MLSNLTPKQKKVLEFIQEYASEHGHAPTQREIKDHFGLKSFGSVQRYLKYLKDAGLIDSDKHSRRGVRIKGGPEHHNFSYSIPLLGNVAAGLPIEAIAQVDERVEVPSYFIDDRHRYFAVSVTGDSMIEKGILEGDQLLCQVKETAKHGEIIVASVDHDVTVKTYYQKNNLIQLLPANRNYGPTPLANREFRVLGIVKALLRRYDL